MAANLKCIYGNKVKLKNLSTGDVAEYELVNFKDEQLKQNKISNYTAIGRAIWAKHEGTEVDIELPNGVTRFQILSVENA